MLFKSKTVVSTPRTYAGSNEVFHRLWQRKLYLKTLKSVESSPADGKERISKSIGVGLLSDMDDGRSAWQGGYQQLPQSDTFPHPFLPQSLGRRDSSKQDRRDSSANQRGERRSRSAQQSRPGAMQPRNMKLPAMLPTQKPVQLRQKDKLVLLPRTQSEQATAEGGLMEAAAQRALSATEAEMTAAPPSSSIFSDIPGYDMPDSRGRVTVYCIAEALKLAELEPIILSRYPEATVNPYNEVLHLSLPFDAQQQPQQPQQNHIQQQQQQEPADCFFFEYGVVCFWGLSAKLEQEILNSIAKKAQQEPLPPREVEVDQFEYNYSTAAPPSMQNDTITISRHHANDHQVKLAICHALAQSTKLCVYEERVLELVFETKHLPQALAIHGTVHVTSQEVAQRIGQVFLQRSAVNLLSSVLDTPEFFWSAPDQLQVLYERSCDYLELETRVEVLNARFQVLQEMLDMLRDHQQNHHSVRLEWIIIWLIAVELVVGLFELMGLFGLVGREH